MSSVSLMHPARDRNERINPCASFLGGEITKSQNLGWVNRMVALRKFRDSYGIDGPNVAGFPISMPICGGLTH